MATVEDYLHFHFIFKLIEDPSYRASMGEQCREAVMRNRGNPERMVRRHEQIYERVIATAPTCISAFRKLAKRHVPARPARASPNRGQHLALLGLARRAMWDLYFRLSRFWRAR